MHCDLEYEEADAQTGRNLRTTALSAMIIKRRSGLEVISVRPQHFRKAIKLREQSYEVHFRYLMQGKITLIRRQSTRVQQYNIQSNDLVALRNIVEFSIGLGAIPKSPYPIPTAPITNALKRKALQDRTNLPSKTLPNTANIYKRPRREEDSTTVLTSDQLRVLDLIVSQRNVFFTGSAGTGKSFLLQQILTPYQSIRAYLRSKCVVATATTGIAAYNIGGVTLHHFAGLDARASTSSIGELETVIRCKRDALQRWKDVDVLVIDEISMLDGRFFEQLEEIARRLRPHRSHVFFGGIQLVLCGDFYQLPPVHTMKERERVLCFETEAWTQGISCIVELRQVFRQKEASFVQLLNALRTGDLTRGMIQTLNQRYDTWAKEGDESGVIRIFSHNKDVVETNTKRLENLMGKKYTYLSTDTGKIELLNASPALKRLSLKMDAQVMLIKSINPSIGLVNGCRGTVVGFTPQYHPIVRFDNGITQTVQQEEFPMRLADSIVATRRQMPLALAWAISIHKSQGLSFSKAVIDLSRVFECGQAYVALSRVRSLEGVRLQSRVDERRLVLADPRVVQFYQSLD